MSEKKPEWFEMAENDEVVTAPKRKSGLNPRPIIALAVSGAIIGAGAILANAEDESPAVAETTSVQTTAATNDPAAPASGSTSGGTTSGGTTSGGSTKSGASGGVQNPNTKSGGIQNPMTKPNRGGDDDGEFEEHRGPRLGGHESGEHEGREHEGREHEGRFGDDD